MIINLAYIKTQLNMRINANRGKAIGSLIKFKRMESHMTLEETADGICSVSYLSKIENNRIDPTDKYLEPLIKKLDITYCPKTNINYEEDIAYIIKKILLLQGIEESFIRDYLLQDDYQAKLILIGYNIANKEYDLAFNAYYDMRIYMKNLNDFECEYLLNMLSIITYQIADYNDSYALLKLIDTIHHYESGLISKY
ncbi:helix-turn-helix domain-containing protein [Acholeplasma sp. OttesenSCG-928-E16]|nr:helix-turn-helix domain-containing protein [Acholeplasma sp. OttesenSCG-928-E16]